MRNGTRRLIFTSIAAALAVAGASLSGARSAHRAAREAALEAEVLARDIEFLEAKLASDTANWLLGGHLADLYTMRFRAEANVTDVVRAETLARATLPFRINRSAGDARLSSILLTQHRFNEAYDAARAAIAVAYPSDAALGAFVDAARAIGDYAGADSALARMDRNSFAGSIRWADRFSDDGQLDAATSYVSQACERLEETGATREQRAWCLTKLAAIEHVRGGPDAARKWLRRALAVRPGHRGATEMLADLAYAQRRWREARRYYERIATPSHADIYLRLAETHRALGRADRSAAYERRFVALASAPAAETLYALPLALHFAEVGRCEEAAELARRELTRRGAAEARERAAWIRFRCADVAGAAIDLAAAAAVAKPSPSATFLHGLLRRAGGDEAGAAALIRSASADPTLLEPHVLEHIRRDDRSAR